MDDQQTPGSGINPDDGLNDLETLTVRLRAAEDFLDRIGQVAGIGGWMFDLSDGRLAWTAQTCRIHDRPLDYVATLEEAVAYYAAPVRAVLETAVLRGIEHGEDWDLELPMQTATGRSIWVRARGAVQQREGRASCLVGTLQDITERRRDIDALLASEQRFRSMFTYSLGLICTHDSAGKLLSANPAACRSLGLAEDQLLGRSIAEFLLEEDRSRFPEYLARIAAHGTDVGRMRLVDTDGNCRVWQYHNVLDTHEGSPAVLGHAQDITEQVAHESRLIEWSYRDALTGCDNRRALADFASEGGSAGAWACVAVDLDHFKSINDTFGHARGDAVLTAMAGFFRTHMRPGDRLVRMGGDEFVILMPGGTWEEAQAFIAQMEASRDNADCGFTAGAAVHGAGTPIEWTLSAADDALYAERRRRRAIAIDD